jgi:hypothetical protein
MIINKLPEDKSNDARKWIENYLPKIKTNRAEIIQNKTFNKDLRKGIPAEVRGEIWTALIGNQLRVN